MRNGRKKDFSLVTSVELFIVKFVSHSISENKKKVVENYNFLISTVNDPKFYPHVSSWLNGDRIDEDIQLGEQQIRSLNDLGKDHKYNGFIDGKHQFIYDMGFAKDLVYYDKKGKKI